MATTQLAPTPVFKAFDNNGNPLFNGQLFTYAAGTSTPQTTYTDSTGNNANTNPVILNSRGEANVWLNPNLAYKFVLEDANGTTIWTVDNIRAPIVQIPYGATSGTNTITLNTTPSFSALTDGLMIEFKIANTNTAAVTINVNSTGALNAYYSNGTTQIGIGELIQNEIYVGIYNSSLNSSAGGWLIINPSSVTTANANGSANAGTLVTSGGTANAQTIANTYPITTLTRGQYQWFLPGAANTGAATLAVDGTAATNIFAYGAALLGGELSTTVPALVKYDGTQWNLINPQDATGSFTITLTGMTGATTGTVNWRIVKGKTAYIMVYADITGTSNAGTMTGTGIPAALSPVTSKTVSLGVIDSGTRAVGTLNTGTSTTWTFKLGYSVGASTWTSSGTKGLIITQTSYTLD